MGKGSIGTDEPTTRQVLVEIRAQEEKRAEDAADLLENPQPGVDDLMQFFRRRL